MEWVMIEKRTAIALLVFLAVTVAGAEERELDPFFPAERLATGAAQKPAQNKWGRDPFDNPFGGVKTSGSSRNQEAPRGSILTGIIYSPDARFAIVGGEVLRIGGKVGGKTITDIRRKGIVLKDPSGGAEEVVLEDFAAGK